MPFKAGFYYSLHEGGKPEQKPVILIHGAGSSHLFWPAEIRRLSGHTVIALDLPGHGHSSGTGSQSISDFTASIVEFLAVTGIFKAVFIGHSMGGAIALQLAQDYPQHVIGIGAISTGANFYLPSDLTAYLSNESTAAAGRQILTDRLLFPAIQQSPTASLNVKTMLTARTGVLFSDWVACSRFDVHQSLGLINVPAYIACGTEDRLTPQGQAQFLASGLPIGRLELFRDAGHLLPLEQPVKLAAGLSHFVNDLLAWNAHYPMRMAFPGLPNKTPRSNKNSQSR